MDSLIKQVAVIRVEDAAAAGATTLTTDTIDLASYRADGVVFVAGIAALTAGTATLQAQHSDDDSSYTAVGSGAAVDTAQEDAVVDLLANGKRYVQATLTRSDASIACNGIYAIVYRCGNLPVTQPATTNVESVVNP